MKTHTVFNITLVANGDTKNLANQVSHAMKLRAALLAELSEVEGEETVSISAPSAPRVNGNGEKGRFEKQWLARFGGKFFRGTDQMKQIVNYLCKQSGGAQTYSDDREEFIALCLYFFDQKKLVRSQTGSWSMDESGAGTSSSSNEQNTDLSQFGDGDGEAF